MVGAGVAGALIGVRVGVLGGVVFAAATRPAAVPGSASVQNGCDVGAFTASLAEMITKHFTGESVACVAFAAHAVAEAKAMLMSAPLDGTKFRSLMSEAKVFARMRFARCIAARRVRSRLTASAARAFSPASAGRWAESGTGASASKAAVARNATGEEKRAINAGLRGPAGGGQESRRDPSVLRGANAR